MRVKGALWGVILVVTHGLVFLAGSVTGKHMTSEYLEHEFEVANASVVLSHYSIYRDIALKIDAAKVDSAKCEAEINATAMFDGLGTCLKQPYCKDALRLKSHEFAPEVFGEAPVPIERRSSCP